MTGVGGRPEVVIEGSNDLEGPWMVSCNSYLAAFMSFLNFCETQKEH